MRYQKHVKGPEENAEAKQVRNRSDILYQIGKNGSKIDPHIDNIDFWFEGSKKLKKKIHIERNTYAGKSMQYIKQSQLLPTACDMTPLPRLEV